MEEKDFEDADNFEKRLDIDYFKNEKLTKKDTLFSISERLNFILNTYPPEAYMNKTCDILKKIKEGIGDPKEMINIIQQLRGKYQESLNNLSKNKNRDNKTDKDKDNKKGFIELIYNTIFKFLNNLNKILEKQ